MVTVSPQMQHRRSSKDYISEKSGEIGLVCLFAFCWVDSLIVFFGAKKKKKSNLRTATLCEEIRTLEPSVDSVPLSLAEYEIGFVCHKLDLPQQSEREVQL